MFKVVLFSMLLTASAFAASSAKIENLIKRTSIDARANKVLDYKFDVALPVGYAQDEYCIELSERMTREAASTFVVQVLNLKANIRLQQMVHVFFGSEVKICERTLDEKEKITEVYYLAPRSTQAKLYIKVKEREPQVGTDLQGDDINFDKIQDERYNYGE